MSIPVDADILMANLTTKKAGEIFPGDKVVGFDRSLRFVKAKSVLSVSDAGALPTIAFSASDLNSGDIIHLALTVGQKVCAKNTGKGGQGVIFWNGIVPFDNPACDFYFYRLPELAVGENGLIDTTPIDLNSLEQYKRAQNDDFEDGGERQCVNVKTDAFQNLVALADGVLVSL